MGFHFGHALLSLFMGLSEQDDFDLMKAASFYFLQGIYCSVGQN